MFLLRWEVSSCRSSDRGFGKGKCKRQEPGRSFPLENLTWHLPRYLSSTASISRVIFSFPISATCRAVNLFWALVILHSGFSQCRSRPAILQATSSCHSALAMVVIEDLPQIRVAVRITGSDSDCVEYDDPDPPITPSVGGTAQHSVAKITQSEDDAEFFVHYRIDNSLGWYGGNKGLAVACYIDGKRMDSKAAMEKHLRNGSIHGRITGVAVPSVRPGKITMKNFKFSKITRGNCSPVLFPFILHPWNLAHISNAVENRKDKLKEDVEAAKHLGVIEVVVCRMVYLGPSQFRAQSVNF